MFEFFQTLDRRWVFLSMLLAVAVPLLFGLRVPEKPTGMVRNVFAAIETLPSGSRVLMAYDYDPAGRGELQPMAAAFTRHTAAKGHTLYYMTLWPQGTPMIEYNLDIIRAEYPDYEYGEDYVNLGFRAGSEGVIQKIVDDLKSTYGQDVYGTSTYRIPMTESLKNIRAMDLIISVGAGTPGTKEWVQYAGTPFDIDIVAGSTGVQAPLFLPYVPRQIIGLLGGVKGAAEYEELVREHYPEIAERPGSAEGLRRMGPQTVAHVLMILLIIAGNVIYFLGRNRRPNGWPA